MNKEFLKTIRVSNSFDPDKDRQNVGPVLGLNCLLMLSAEDKKSLLACKEFKCNSSESLSCFLLLFFSPKNEN